MVHTSASEAAHKHTADDEARSRPTSSNSVSSCVRTSTSESY